MSKEILDGKTLKSMLIGGAENMRSSSKEINDLNVFPVPDGDTGTNMAKTMSSAASEVLKNPTLGAGELAKAVCFSSKRSQEESATILIFLIYYSLSFSKEILSLRGCLFFKMNGGTTEILSLQTRFLLYFLCTRKERYQRKRAKGG